MKPIGDPVTLPNWLPPRELSPNASRKIPAGMKARVKRDAQHTVWGAVRHVGWPQQAMTDPRRVLRVTMTRTRHTLDGDNAVALLKFLVDAVRVSGALWDDSPRYCRLEVVQERGESATVLELFEEDA